MLFWEVVLRFHLISKGVPDTNRLNAWWTNTLQCFGKWSFSFPLHTSKRVLTASLGSLFWGAALTLTTHPKNPISLDQESAKFSWKGPDSNYFELSGHTVTDLTTQLFCSVVAPWKKWVFQWNSSYQLLLKLKSQVLLLYWPSSSEHKPMCQCHSFSSSPIIHLSSVPPSIREPRQLLQGLASRDSCLKCQSQDPYQGQRLSFHTICTLWMPRGCGRVALREGIFFPTNHTHLCMITIRASLAGFS